MNDIKLKLKEIFETTIENGERIDVKNPEELNFCNLMFKAAGSKTLYNIFDSNLCMFNCNFLEGSSIFILVGIPTSSLEKISNKEMSEKIMDIVDTFEKTFITLDYCISKDVKEDRFVYLIIVKKIKE